MQLGISPRGIVLIVVASVLMTAASLMLRGSIDRAGGFGGDLARLHEDIFKLLVQPLFIFGVGLYGLGTLIWMRAIATEPLSIGYPILMAVSFIIAAAGAAYFFQEAITPPKLIGMGIILVGVVIASFG